MATRPYSKVFAIASPAADIDMSDVGPNESLFIISANVANNDASTRVVTLNKWETGGAAVGNLIEPGKSIPPKGSVPVALAGTIFQGGGGIKAGVDVAATVNLFLSGTITSKN